MSVIAYLRPFRLYLLIAGGLCLSFGVYQKYGYSDLVQNAVRTIEANRLDGQDLERAEASPFGSAGLLAYNMGVRAYRSDNLKKASEHFYRVIHENEDPPVKGRAYYNLGNILVQLELPKKAAEMYQESLRLDPNDWEAKYNLERLYVFYQLAFPDDSSQASLEREPGAEKEQKAKTGKHGPDQPDI
jgi:tetratricopeptide (TPR) repeat protein